MGDLRDWSREDNGFHLEERPPSSSSSSSSSCCDAIGGDSWRRAEEVTQGIIAKIQPNSVSEERRRAVIDYVQRLLSGYLRCEVLPYGSVPLKTYLPDGDIDLTAFGGMVSEDALATEVISVLEREDQNGLAEFTVKDVQYIRAEVKLVKCIVQNIVVDISFNQLGGLSTLCFLEKVDRLIGKHNLFKRSIILIKAWCYYESRILGAHHGLISTYALETMVLYIFHIFHSSLDGPLAVLYKFLDYYSKFDWEKYCVSLRGPVVISSLPEFAVDTSDKCGAVEPLLSNDFLRECAEMFSPPSKALGPSARTFQLKHLNIVDPLKESNNLGRSVSKGNLARIRSAFALGARKLEKILSQPDESLTDEIRTFFTSTLDRHGSGERPDIQYNVLNYGYNNGFVFNVPSPYMELPRDDQYSGSQSINAITLDEPPNYRRTPPRGPSSEEVNMSSSGFTAEQSSVLSAKLKEVDTFEQNLEMSNEASGSEGGSTFSQSNHFPNLDITKDAELIDGDSEREHSENSGDADVSSSSSQMSVGLSPDEPKLHTSQLSRLSLSAEDFVPSRHHGLWASRSPYQTQSLPDLDGDYENQLSSLQFGRRWFDYAMGAAPVPPVPPTFVAQYHKQNHYPQRSPKAAPPLMPGFYPRSPQVAAGASFGGEDMHKPRGTGTYFPKMQNHYKDRHSTGRGRHQAQARSPSPRYNGPAMTFPQATFSDRNEQEPQQARGRPTASSDPYWSANGTIHSSEEISQFGTASTEGGKQPISTTEPSNSPRSVSQRPKPTSETNKNRLIPVQSYHLKDEDDFPPLSV